MKGKIKINKKQHRRTLRGRINLLKKNKAKMGLMVKYKLPKIFKLGNKAGEGFKAFSRKDLHLIREIKHFSDEQIKTRVKMGLVFEIKEKENSDFILEFEKEPVFKSRLENKTNSLKDFPKERKRLLTLLNDEKMFFLTNSASNDYKVKKFYYPNIKYSNALINEIKDIEVILKDNNLFNNNEMPFIQQK